MRKKEHISYGNPQGKHVNQLDFCFPLLSWMLWLHLKSRVWCTHQMCLSYRNIDKETARGNRNWSALVWWGPVSRDTQTKVKDSNKSDSQAVGDLKGKTIWDVLRFTDIDSSQTHKHTPTQKKRGRTQDCKWKSVEIVGSETSTSVNENTASDAREFPSKVLRSDTSRVWMFACHGTFLRYNIHVTENLT